MTVASPWEGRVPVTTTSRAGAPVTLVEGQTFSLSDRAGDMSPDHPGGLFLMDTRVVSQWELRVNGHCLEPLTVAVPSPFAATFVGRGHPREGHADADVVVFRHRHVGDGMRERIVVTSYGLERAPVKVQLFCDVDFADLFEVKENRVRRRGRHSRQVGPTALRYRHDGVHGTKEVEVALPEAAAVEPGVATWHRELGPGESWELCLEVRVLLCDAPIVPRFTCDGVDDDAVPTTRLASWRATLPEVSTDSRALTEAITRCGEDLGALRIFDPDHPDVPILAAGAPWFMAVFGRDSLLTAWMTLIADSSLAHGVLETLARFQGTDVNPETEEEPGKILHEMRFAGATGLAFGGGNVYYGSVDATPLFVMLLGELRRWDPGEQSIEALLPHADRALQWIEDFGDRDGDGYVEYQRQSTRGLTNQGWKDSWDAIRSADGRLSSPPIALAEVQGYVYAAYVARAHFAREAGDATTYERFRDKAVELRRRFNEDFWLEERGWYALGLDGDKRPVDALASNIGHCLWTGIIEPERAAVVADRLLDPALFSGWGIRTLASSMAAYNPVSYHNGSVWPHDNAICAAGLVRYGFTEHAHRVIEAQLAVADRAGGRLPELFAGFGRDVVPTPGSYPTSCSPQAWAAAAPMLWLRTLLQVDPWGPHGQVWLHPELPPSIRTLHVDGIRVGADNLTVTVTDGHVEANSTGDLDVIAQRRPPLTAALVPSDIGGAERP